MNVILKPDVIKLYELLSISTSRQIQPLSVSLVSKIYGSLSTCSCCNLICLPPSTLGEGEREGDRRVEFCPSLPSLIICFCAKDENTLAHYSEYSDYHPPCFSSLTTHHFCILWHFCHCMKLKVTVFVHCWYWMRLTPFPESRFNFFFKMRQDVFV